MSLPEERDIDAGSESDPSPSPLSASITSAVAAGFRRVLMPATGDDRRGRTSAATNNGSEDRALPTADSDDRPGRDDPGPFSEPPGQSSHRGTRGGVGGRRTYQFRKAKSAATFMLDGVSYTIGE